ncbi:MAG: hypothetical protein ACF8Q5_10070 [Phycisphaerales bacterium JB040]
MHPDRPEHPALTIRVSLHPDPVPGIESLPASPGVLLLTGEQHAALQIAATGNLRDFAASRLHPDAALGQRADLRAHARTLLAATVGSPLEADLLTLDLARHHLPTTYQALTDRSRCWVLRFDPEGDPPTWKRIDSREALKGPRPTNPRTLLGPFPAKNDPVRLGELLDDAFELCRYPRELAKAPHGSPCAYKDMGCPGACDGSETLTAYARRAEMAHAFAAGTGQDAAPRELLTAQMHDAAQSHRFEQAARLKERLDRLDALSAPAFRALGTLERLALLAVAPSEKRGRARLIALTGGEACVLADAEPHCDHATLDALTAPLDPDRTPPEPFPVTHPAIERLSVFARHWFRPASRARTRRTTVFDLRPGLPTRADLLGAIGLAAEPSDHPGADFSETDLSGPGDPR